MTFLSTLGSFKSSFFFEVLCGLFRCIGPEVRAVSVDYEDKTFYLQIYSEKELSAEDKENFDIGTLEIDAIPLHTCLQVRFFVVPMSEPLSTTGDLFYKRKEPFWDAQKSSRVEPQVLMPIKVDRILALGVEKMGEVIMAIVQALLSRMVFEVRAIGVDYDIEKKIIYLQVYSEKELPKEDKKGFQRPDFNNVLRKSLIINIANFSVGTTLFG